MVSDLRTAEKAFKEPQVPYSIVPVGVHSTDTSGADEWDLDTQYSDRHRPPSVKHLYIYDTTSLTDSDIGLEFNKWASQDAKAASASFGERELTPYADGLMVTNDQVMNEAMPRARRCTRRRVTPVVRAARSRRPMAFLRAGRPR